MEDSKPILQRGRSKLGDVYEITTSTGFAYIQHVNKHAEYGQLIRILPGIYKDRLDHLDELVRQLELYYTFFPVSAAMNKGMIKKIGNFGIPTWARTMPMLRRAGWRGAEGKAHNWFIVKDNVEKFVKTLTVEQRGLSIISIWNPALLVNRIEKSWIPLNDT